MAMVRVRYTGNKARKVDAFAGKEVVWDGRGDVQPVHEQHWALLSTFAGTWELVDEPPTERANDQPTSESQHLDLASMGDDELKAFAKHRGLSVDLRKRGDALRAAISDAVGATGGA